MTPRFEKFTVAPWPPTDSELPRLERLIHTLPTQTNQTKQRLLTASTERDFSHVTDLAYYRQFSWTWTGVHGSGTCGRSQRGGGSPQSGPTCRSAEQVR